LGQVSALTLGGGGIGSVWGTVERAEAVATVQAGVSVIGIRAVAAGSLADRLDRPVEADHRAARDYEAAAAFRRVAAERGESAALLAHRLRSPCRSWQPSCSA
jgi:hypothetical protein